MDESSRTDKPCDFTRQHLPHQWGDAYGRYVCPGVVQKKRDDVDGWNEAEQDDADR